MQEKKSKNKFYYFVPWKRAETDPSLVKKGTEVHINPLPSDATHEDLYSVFKKFGDIIDIRILPKKEKGNCFAFVRFLEKESVDKILRERNLTFQGRHIYVSKSKEETTLFIGNIRRSWSREYVENLMRERVPNFDEFRFFEDTQNPNRNRGYCFIKFNNPIKAKEAYEKLSKNIVIDGTSITVDWADEFSEDDVNKVQIHLSGLNDDIDIDNLYTVFGQYGEIINIKLARDMEGKGRKDYGFITYSTPEAASKAVKEFCWKDYFDYPINIQFARKISSIIKHKQKIQGDMLERKRKRDNLFKNEKKYSDNSDSEDSEKNSKTVINEFTNMINNISPNNNVNQLMTKMMSILAQSINKGTDVNNPVDLEVLKQNDAQKRLTNRDKNNFKQDPLNESNYKLN